MKNNIKNMILKLLCLLGFVFSLVSCAEVDEDEGDKPALTPEGNAIIVSFAVDEKAKYVNIFRREVISVDPEEYGEVENIGQVIPVKNQETAFTFTDRLLCKGVLYQYRVRYCIGNFYYFSNWSDAKKTDDSDFITEDQLAYEVPVDCYFLYNEKTSSLMLKGGEIAPPACDDGNMMAALVFSYKENNSVHSRVFSLFEETPNVLENTVIDLRSLLSSDFFGKDISLDYILAEKITEGGINIDDEEKKKVYYEIVTWTLPSKIPLKNESDEELESIKIKIKTADNGHDYSFEGIESSVSSSMNTINSKNTSKEFFIF